MLYKYTGATSYTDVSLKKATAEKTAHNVSFGEPLSCEALKTGDRVAFVANPHGYNVGKHNPLVGTKYFCLGTVLKLDHTYVVVIWDNKLQNTYRSDSLAKVIEHKVDLTKPPKNWD